MKRLIRLRPFWSLFVDMIGFVTLGHSALTLLIGRLVNRRVSRILISEIVLGIDVGMPGLR